MAMGDPIRVRVVRKTDEALPAYETAQSAGMDLRANLEEPIALAPGERALVPTGLFLQIPDGYEAQVRPRSGLALKRGCAAIEDEMDVTLTATDQGAEALLFDLA